MCVLASLCFVIIALIMACYYTNQICKPNYHPLSIFLAALYHAALLCSMCQLISAGIEYDKFNETLIKKEKYIERLEERINNLEYKLKHECK